MRNLKRALSLAVASVMLLGMMVVGASAASYPDVDTNDHVEAIEILNAAEVMIGDEKGNFNPDKVVTRAEMSVIISKLLYGSDLSVASFADVETFNDVPAWAQGYVNLCASLGIVAGVGEGKFDPSATVTTAQAALMLLRALDVDVEINATTDYKVAAMTAAEDADLFAGMDVLAANSGLTRNNVAQMALNAMMYNDSEEIYVVTDGKATYEFDDMKDALLYTALLGEGWNVYTAKDYTGSLIDEVFEISVVDGTDAYGRPATVYDHADWAAAKVFAETADYTFVIKGDTNLYDVLKDNNLTKKVLVDEDTAKKHELDNSSVIELFVDDDKNLTVTVEYSYAMAEIAEVAELDEDDDEDAIEDGAKYAITIETANGEFDVYDVNIAGFDAETFVEGAKIVWTGLSNAYDFENIEDFIMIDVTIADEVEGKVTATGSDYFRIDGVKYTVAAACTDKFGKDDEGIFYLDPNGFVLGFEESKEENTTDIDDVVYAVANYEKTVTDDFGTETVTTYLQVMHLNGDVESIVIHIDGEDDFGSKAYTKGALYTYNTYTAKKVVDGVNYKGTSKLSAWAGDDDYYVGTIAAGTELEKADTKVAASVEKASQVRLNKGTSYILVDGEKADLEVEVIESGINATTAAEGIVIATKSGSNYVAKYIVLPGSEIDTTVEYEDVIYIAADADFEYVTVADEDCTKIEFYNEDGVKAAYEQWIDVKGTEKIEAGFYTYSVDEDNVYTLEAIEALTLTANYDDETGVIAGTYVSEWEGAITLDEQYLVDIAAGDASFIDLHDTDNYKYSIKSVEALEKAADREYFAELVIYVDGGAAIIVVL